MLVKQTFCESLPVHIKIKKSFDAAQEYELPLVVLIIGQLTKCPDTRTECLILSSNNPKGAQQVIESLQTYAQGVGAISLCYQADTQEARNGYHQLINSNKLVNAFTCTEISPKETLYSWVTNCPTPQILIARDNVVLTEPINLSENIRELERTFAYGFYFGIAHDQHLLPDQHIWNDIYAWKFNTAKHAWCNHLDMTLLRTQDMQQRIAYLPNVTDIDDFIRQWENDLSLNQSKAGLFFKALKVTGATSIITKKLPPLPRLKMRRRRLHSKHKQRLLSKKKRKINRKGKTRRIKRHLRSSS